MPPDAKHPPPHLYLIEVLLAVALLTGAGFFLVRGMQRAQLRRQTQQLISAMDKHDEATIKSLVQANPDLRNVKDNDGNAPLHWAASWGNKEVVELLLAKGADPNAKDNNDVMPLHCAAATGNKEIAELLLAKGADPNAKNNSGATPLHCAAATGNKEMAELLLAKGADPNAKNNYGQTPLDLVKASIKHKALIELLRAHGAKE